MTRHIYLILPAVLSLLAFSACKKTKATPGARTQQQSTDKPLASAFVTKSPIVVFESPDAKSKVVTTLPIGVQVGIFATRVPDKAQPDQVFWYKVRYAPTSANLAGSAMPVEGYVSEREEVLRNNLMVFAPAATTSFQKETAPGKFEAAEETQAAMATTGVNLRASPALNAQILRVLKNGEVMSVLEQSGKTYLLDKKNGYWYKLKSRTGEEGYAFGGFLVTGPESDIRRLEESGFQFQSGWVAPRSNNAVVYASPLGGARVQISQDAYYLPEAWRTGAGTLEKNIYMKVDGLTTKGEPQRYRIVLRQPVDYEIFQEHYFYVDKNSVNFVRDFYGVSEKQPAEIDREFARQVNRFLGGNLNLQCSRVKEFSGGSPDAPRQFTMIEAAIGASASGSEEYERCRFTENQTVIAEKVGDKLVFTFAKRGEFRDLDGDQVPELVSESGGRGYISLEIYAIHTGKTVLLASLSNEADKMGVVGGFEVDKDGFLHIQPAYECSRADSDAEIAKTCAENIAYVRKNFKFLKLNPSLPVFPFKGKLEGDKFVQVANDEG